ncbi:hypothetical protein TFKS16_2214 [Tannerella forsythia KS16]|uniref:DUF3078 domain-containing protein n=2 Tax=Tannerella forsythia TaxID=28112 RepID=A0A1D3UQ85_TANFO|nr:DUF3078 domain-containing protein [Tannerella forsythia]PDP43648.1 DUF3078 domain-containing protein [Tannerella forsythia]SCQ22394.1 hypothetical protein TFUB4_02044 [Tannerella forsythia]SCQ23505.1 hypothetical protein TFUB20_02080 [Tannerella forsythia]BAR49679.1 hypothetical protein TF3313_2223 [Tannerella forsythia 3313]BAR52416.1 hypothetical protein TFKS16_2214 [Tannerella forsythia KS16]
MKKTLFVVVAVACAASVVAQDVPKDTSYWKKSGSSSLTFGQTSFTNWAAGGNNSVSVLASFAGKLGYEKDPWMWDNSVDLGYGLSYQGSDQIKNDDHIDLATRLGYKASSLWAYAAELNFKSQFYKGYGKYPVEDETKYISKFMAPGYLISSVGVNYTHPKEDFKVLLSPMSEKMTFVTDRRLSDEGTYGVDQGKKVFAEFGALAKATYSRKFTENVLFGTELLLTSAYRTFGNVDMDWRLSLDWKLNKYFTFKANTYLLYDDNIKFVDKDGTRKGPRVQFKEVIGLGFGYIF